MPLGQPRYTLFPYTTLFRSTTAERSRKKTGVIGRLFKSKKAEDDENAGDGEASPEKTSEALPDSEASITTGRDRKSTRLNSSHQIISYAVFCLKKTTHCPRT